MQINGHILHEFNGNIFIFGLQSIFRAVFGVWRWKKVQKWAKKKPTLEKQPYFRLIPLKWVANEKARFSQMIGLGWRKKSFFKRKNGFLAISKFVQILKNGQKSIFSLEKWNFFATPCPKTRLRLVFPNVQLYYFAFVCLCMHYHLFFAQLSSVIGTITV